MTYTISLLTYPCAVANDVHNMISLLTYPCMVANDVHDITVNISVYGR